MPAEKERSPAPVTTIARMPGRAPVTASAMTSRSARRSAFAISGRSMVIQRVPYSSSLI
jgi:hypothetical protein